MTPIRLVTQKYYNTRNRHWNRHVYVHQHSGLMVIYDESQFLIPTRYSQSTPPARINFVRCQVIDRGLPCALFATPQSYRQTLDQYVKTTGYRVEQWLGRMAPAEILPSDLDKEDLMAIARLHFPALPASHLKLIIARAMQSEGYIKNLEFAGKRALFIAQENGRTQPSVEDVERAIADMMPVAAAAPAQTSSRRRSPPALTPEIYSRASDRRGAAIPRAVRAPVADVLPCDEIARPQAAVTAA